MREGDGADSPTRAAEGGEAARPKHKKNAPFTNESRVFVFAVFFICLLQSAYQLWGRFANRNDDDNGTQKFALLGLCR
jgi:hypothetical protein